MKIQALIKKYYWVAILIAIILFILGGAFYRTSLYNSYKERFVKYDFEELTGAKYKIPLFDKIEVTLTGGLITFVNGGKDFKLLQFDTLIKGANVTILPMKIVRNDGREAYLVSAFVKEGDEYIQKQSALLAAVVKNQKFELDGDILRVKFDTLDKYGNPSFEEKFFNTQKGKFSPYYPYIDNGAIGLEIIQNPWIWKKTTYLIGETVTPKQDKFIITFDENGNFVASTDCNTLNGKFVMTQSGSVTFGKIGSTKMACENSQEAEFGKMLIDAVGFTQTGSTLELELKSNGGKMLFEKDAKNDTLEKK